MTWQAPFDASREFEVRTRDMPIAGRRYAVGEGFDKSTVDERLLRRLYETRIINFAGVSTDIVKRDPLLAEAKAEKRARKGRPTAEQLEAAEAMADKPGNTKKVLLEAAKGLETVRADMNKKAIALELIRAGRGPA